MENLTVDAKWNSLRTDDPISCYNVESSWKKMPNTSRFYVLISFSSNENLVLFVIYLRFVDIVKRWHTVNCMYHIVYHFFWCWKIMVWFFLYKLNREKASLESLFRMPLVLSNWRLLIVVILSVLACTFFGQTVGLLVVRIAVMCVNMFENNVHLPIAIQSLAQIDKVPSIGQRFAVCLVKTVLLPTIQTLVHRIDQKFRVRIDAYRIETIICAIPNGSNCRLNFASIVRCTTSYRCTNIPMRIETKTKTKQRQKNRTALRCCCVGERVSFWFCAEQHLHAMVKIVENTVTSSCTWLSIASAWPINPNVYVVIVIVQKVVVAFVNFAVHVWMRVHFTSVLTLSISKLFWISATN